MAKKKVRKPRRSTNQSSQRTSTKGGPKGTDSRQIKIMLVGVAAIVAFIAFFTAKFGDQTLYERISSSVEDSQPPK